MRRLFPVWRLGLPRFPCRNLAAESEDEDQAQDPLHRVRPAQRGMTTIMPERVHFYHDNVASHGPADLISKTVSD